METTGLVELGSWCKLPFVISPGDEVQVSATENPKRFQVARRPRAKVEHRRVPRRGKVVDMADGRGR